MTPEDRPELEGALREQIAGLQAQLDSLAARQAVTETILMAALGHAVRLAGSPATVVAPIMRAAEDALQAQHENAEAEAKQRLGRALAHFRMLDEALVANLARNAPTVGNA